MIYYGLQILNPEIFLFATAIITAIVSLSTGSSWSTIATIGIALLGIGQALGLPVGLIGGAIISGAYFGDKMSPLSDTTNLAPAMAGTDLFTHIRYMMYTTIPSFIITLIIFLVIGFNYSTDISSEHINQMLNILSNTFTITPLLFIVPLLVIILIVKKVPAIPSLFIGVLLGALFAIIFQPHIVISKEVSGETESTINSTYKGIINSMSIKTDLEETNNKINDIIPVKYKSKNGEQLEMKFSETMILGEVDAKHPAVLESKNRGNLLKSAGMYGMLNTIWLIICAMIFGGILESTGLLRRIAEPIINYAKSTGSLVATTTGTCIFFNITASDQYISIVVPGRMFADSYKEKGLAPENLSRTLEDSGTVTSVLIPWNTCGATQSAVLGVATLSYLPYCFFNLISPIMTIIYAYLGIKIKKLRE
ncbi:MAG: sodium:proton antiporter [Flavobacteriales bacterium]|nr:sodium:proton antiporter [Flavobacteriales bacterium]MBT7620660.1 sodium:proton antiporter [Flavobacteriales bacterium]